MAIKWVQGDTAPNQPFAVTQNGVALNLTGCTVNFNIGDATTYAIINSGHATCVIDNAPLGLCHYVPLAADTANVGSFVGQLAITFGGGTEQTSKNVPITVSQEVK